MPAVFASEAPSSVIEVIAEDLDDTNDIDQALEKLEPAQTPQSPSVLPVEFPAETGYISNDMFTAAGGTTASTPPPPDEGSFISSEDLKRAEILAQIKDRHGLNFQDPNSIPISIVRGMEMLLISGIAIADDDQLKETLLTVLPIMDQRKFKKDERLTGTRTSVLFSMLRRELRNRGQVDLSNNLETSLQSLLKSTLKK